MLFSLFLLETSKLTLGDKFRRLLGNRWFQVVVGIACLFFIGLLISVLHDTLEKPCSKNNPNTTITESIKEAIEKLEVLQADMSNTMATVTVVENIYNAQKLSCASSSVHTSFFEREDKLILKGFALLKEEFASSSLSEVLLLLKNIVEND